MWLFILFCLNLLVIELNSRVIDWIIEKLLKEILMLFFVDAVVVQSKQFDRKIKIEQKKI